MKAFRCLICGDTYIADAAPDRCPFCGVVSQYIVPIIVYKKSGKVEMSEKTKKLCFEALRLELMDKAHYEASAEATDNDMYESLFKRLAKQESEHAEIIMDMLGIEDVKEIKAESFGSEQKDFAHALEKEREAIKFYLRIANEATEERVREVFYALADVENHHSGFAVFYG